MLKKSFTVLMLLLLPLSQARAVMACSMMGSMPMDSTVMEECCCPQRDALDSERKADPANRCCTVVLEARQQGFATSVAPPSVEKPAYTQQHDEPPAASFQSVATFVSILPGRHALAPRVDPPRSLEDLYLLTARLRL